MTDQVRPARLLLADGSVHEGHSIGAPGEASGEVVFNTSMTGYQEILTDPSYRGQIVLLTNPLIGNYGVNDEDSESERPWVEGFVVRELSALASNHRSTQDLGSWLQDHGIVAMAGVDTRALTRRIRRQGAMKGLITTQDSDLDALRRRLQDVPELEGRDLVQGVSRQDVLVWDEGPAEGFAPAPQSRAAAGPVRHVVVVDYGCKANILRSLVACGFKVSVVPARFSAAEVLELQPDGVLLSNGPGDPRALSGATKAVSELLGQVPIMGICLGQQVLAAALGARIFKLKFGHHGGNHPVLDVDSGRVAITAQNHGFAVQEASLEALDGRVTHRNLNDDTVAGLEFRGQGAFAVQFHPEAAPGPHDSLGVFQRFRSMMTPAREQN